MILSYAMLKCCTQLGEAIVAGYFLEHIPKSFLSILFKWQNFLFYNQNEQHLPFRGDECVGQGRIWIPIPGTEEKFFINICNESRKWSQLT